MKPLEIIKTLTSLNEVNGTLRGMLHDKILIINQYDAFTPVKYFKVSKGTIWIFGEDRVGWDFKTSYQNLGIMDIYGKIYPLISKYGEDDYRLNIDLENRFKTKSPYLPKTTIYMFPLRVKVRPLVDYTGCYLVNNAKMYPIIYHDNNMGAILSCDRFKIKDKTLSGCNHLLSFVKVEYYGKTTDTPFNLDTVSLEKWLKENESE